MPGCWLSTLCRKFGSNLSACRLLMRGPRQAWTCQSRRTFASRHSTFCLLAVSTEYSSCGFLMRSVGSSFYQWLMIWAFIRIDYYIGEVDRMEEAWCYDHMQFLLWSFGLECGLFTLRISKLVFFESYYLELLVLRWCYGYPNQEESCVVHATWS